MIEFIDEKAIISPPKHDLGISVAITTFSKHLEKCLFDMYPCKEVHRVTGGVDNIIYEPKGGNGKRIMYYRSPVGAPAAVAALEETVAIGAKKVIAFGICGTLEDIPPRNFIVPEFAMRDEGTSMHYMPPTDRIEIKNSNKVIEHLASNGVHFITGGTWTTDGFYRETRTRAEYMRNHGCVAVDMECSALQAACNYIGAEFYTFFIAADCLAGDEWEPNYLLNPEAVDAESVAVSAAVKLALSL